MLFFFFIYFHFPFRLALFRYFLPIEQEGKAKAPEINVSVTVFPFKCYATRMPNIEFVRSNKENGTPRRRVYPFNIGICCLNFAHKSILRHKNIKWYCRTTSFKKITETHRTKRKRLWMIQIKGRKNMWSKSFYRMFYFVEHSYSLCICRLLTLNPLSRPPPKAIRLYRLSNVKTKHTFVFRINLYFYLQILHVRRISRIIFGFMLSSRIT